MGVGSKPSWNPSVHTLGSSSVSSCPFSFISLLLNGVKLMTEIAHRIGNGGGACEEEDEKEAEDEDPVESTVAVVIVIVVVASPLVSVLLQPTAFC